MLLLVRVALLPVLFAVFMVYVWHLRCSIAFIDGLLVSNYALIQRVSYLIAKPYLPRRVAHPSSWNRGQYIPETKRGAPPFAVWAKGGKNQSQTLGRPRAHTGSMTQGLHRYYGARHLHFITCSCYRRAPLLGTARRRDLFLTILEQARRRYGFAVMGYVVMPEHVHLLISEPEAGTPSTVMQVVKQRFARRVLAQLRRTRRPGQLSLWDGEAVEAGHVWQRRFYDFNVWSECKRMEKLRYMHRNPVKRGLVGEAEQWRWSSYRQYAYGEAGPIKINEWRRIELAA